jgi:hypothetical protein
VTELVEADEKIELFEWSLQRVLRAHLRAAFDRPGPTRARHKSLEPVKDRCELLLSTLAWVGHGDEARARAGFAAGAKKLKVAGLSIQPSDRCGLEALDKALDALAAVAPQAKRRLVAACAACVEADQQVTASEAELVRALAASLGAPMPPLLPGQTLAK